MDRRLVNIIIALVAVLVIFLLVSLIGGAINENLKLDETALLRFVFVIIGLIAVFVVYWFTRGSGVWDVGTREVVYMAIGAALYAVFSYLYNGTVFVVPSVSRSRSARPLPSPCSLALPSGRQWAFSPVPWATCLVMLSPGSVSRHSGVSAMDWWVWSLVCTSCSATRRGA